MTEADQIRIAHTVPGVVCGDKHGTTCARVREAMTAAANWEQQRAVNLVREGRDHCARLAADAQAKGDRPSAGHFVAMANTLHAVSLRIALPEGGCEACLNTKQVPSALMPGAMVPCDCTRGAATTEGAAS